ncbi:MAG: hypothetical protein M0042_01340 [Nitrospiraceae bacterium]|nr:hypothetical protein [Nitrospiraceae bacterium]
MRLVRILYLCFVLAAGLVACQTKPEGAVEGAVTPAGAQAGVVASRAGKDVGAIPAVAADGKFRLTLAPGSYVITVTSPDSPYPLRFSDIDIEAGKTTRLPPIEIAGTPPLAGKASLSGRVIPPRPDCEVRLLYEGHERAMVRPDREGRYEFITAPGQYVVQATAPGYGRDVIPVLLAEDHRSVQTAVLFPVTRIDGVDWDAGVIRAKGIGLPPAEAENETAKRAMAGRAALADAQRNMLRTIEQIRVDSSRTVKDAMQNKRVEVRVQGFLKGYTVVSEKELGDGRVEVILQLPLNGPDGLSRYIEE